MQIKKFWIYEKLLRNTPLQKKNNLQHYTYSFVCQLSVLFSVLQYYIETSPFILTANLLTDFCITGTLACNG